MLRITSGAQDCLRPRWRDQRRMERRKYAECHCRIGRRWNVRGDPKQARYREKAVPNGGGDVLNDSRSTPAIRFEAPNALGIAWMRFPEKSVERVANEGAT